MIFSTANTERLRISTGNVNINNSLTVGVNCTVTNDCFVKTVQLGTTVNGILVIDDQSTYRRIQTWNAKP